MLLDGDTRTHRRYNAITALRSPPLIALAGHRQRHGGLTCNALLAWLGYQRAT